LDRESNSVSRDHLLSGRLCQVGLRALRTGFWDKVMSPASSLPWDDKLVEGVWKNQDFQSIWVSQLFLTIVDLSALFVPPTVRCVQGTSLGLHVCFLWEHIKGPV
jgi:hypothetical protein